jgi:hypothetical protein
VTELTAYYLHLCLNIKGTKDAKGNVLEVCTYGDHDLECGVLLQDAQPINTIGIREGLGKGCTVHLSNQFHERTSKSYIDLSQESGLDEGS